MSAVSWYEVGRPVGLQPIPTWCKGLHIDWGNGHAGWPTVKLKCYEDIGDWPGRVFVQEAPGVFIARSDDGRVECHYHCGAIQDMVAWQVYRGEKQVCAEWQISDSLLGETPMQAAQRAGQKHLDLCNRLDKDSVAELRFKPVRATTAQEGYAGRHFTIPMADGELVLRGPWHGSPPAGTVEITITKLAKYPGGKKLRDERIVQAPWHEALGMYGVSITEDLFLRLLARFAPEVRVARVEWLPGRFHLEPFKDAWGQPKSFIYEGERTRPVSERPGPFPEVYGGPKWSEKLERWRAAAPAGAAV